MGHTEGSCFAGHTKGAILWEGGHLYQSKGPTMWSVVGWDILTSLRGPDDHTVIMVDDVHGIELLDPRERSLDPVRFKPDPEPCFVVKESDMAIPGHRVLELLKQLPRRRRARQTMHPRRWCCSGFALTTPNGGGPGEPLCLLYDLGLTWHKYHRFGFCRMVNILPEFYLTEQKALIRIARKVMADVDIRAVLYDLDGNWRWLRREDI